MKQYLLYVINGVLVVAVIILYVMHFTGNSSKEEGEISSARKDAKGINRDQLIPIAYINVDSLLLKYNFAKEANERLLAKSQHSQAELNKQMNQWQKEAADFQKKVQNNSFLSRERAEQENARLMKRRQELEQLDGKLSQALMQEQKKMNEQLKDTINTFLKQYNKKRKYQVILSNTMNDNVLYAKEGYDITSEVIDLLNARYKKKGE
ncbi:MAG: OmpH family outer membrane protein [Paludibacteraceae bacterium]|nr:OmpH family outer membrane protein [Paludibacteraceae bacterium]